MLLNIAKKAPSSHFWGLWSPDSCVSENLYTKICMEDFDDFAPSVYRVWSIIMESWVGSCTFCRGGIFEKRESELSSRFRASTVPHRRYRLEPVFRTKLCKTGTQQVPSRVPMYYYILVSKGSGIGVLTNCYMDWGCFDILSSCTVWASFTEKFQKSLSRFFICTKIQ